MTIKKQAKRKKGVSRAEHRAAKDKAKRKQRAKNPVKGPDAPKPRGPVKGPKAPTPRVRPGTGAPNEKVGGDSHKAWLEKRKKKKGEDWSMFTARKT